MYTLDEVLKLAKTTPEKGHLLIQMMTPTERDEVDQLLTNWLVDEIKVNNLNASIEEMIALKCMIYFVYGEETG